MPSRDELRTFSPEEEKLYHYFRREPLNWLVLDYERDSNSSEFERDPRKAFLIFCEVYAVKKKLPMIRRLGKSKLRRDEQSKLTYELLPGVSWTDVKEALSWPKIAKGLQDIPSEKLTPNQEDRLLGRDLLFRDIAFAMRLARDRLDPIPAPPPHDILCVASDDNNYAYLKKTTPKEEKFYLDDLTYEDFFVVLRKFEMYAGAKSLSYHKTDALEIFMDQMLEPCWRSFVEVLGMERGKRMMYRGASGGVGFEEIKEALTPIRYSNETLFRAYVIALGRTHKHIVDIFKEDWIRAPEDEYETLAPWGSPAFYNAAGGQKGKKEDHVKVWLANDMERPVAQEDDDDDDETASMHRRAVSEGSLEEEERYQGNYHDDPDAWVINNVLGRRRQDDEKTVSGIWHAYCARVQKRSKKGPFYLLEDSPERVAQDDDDETASMPRHANGAGGQRGDGKGHGQAWLTKNTRRMAQKEDERADMPRRTNGGGGGQKSGKKEHQSRYYVASNGCIVNNFKAWRRDDDETTASRDDSYFLPTDGTEPASKQTQKKKQARPEKGAGRGSAERVRPNPRATQPEPESTRKRKRDEGAEPKGGLMAGTQTGADGEGRKRSKRWEPRDAKVSTVVVSSPEANTGCEGGDGDGGDASSSKDVVEPAQSRRPSRYNLRSRPGTRIKPP